MPSEPWVLRVALGAAGFLCGWLVWAAIGATVYGPPRLLDGDMTNLTVAYGAALAIAGAVIGLLLVRERHP